MIIQISLFTRMHTMDRGLDKFCYIPTAMEASQDSLSATWTFFPAVLMTMMLQWIALHVRSFICSYLTPLHYRLLLMSFFYFSSTDGTGYLDIQLVGGATHYMGVVEVLYDVNDHVWGTVCNTTWSYSDAEVACRSLGYTGGGKKTGSNVSIH